MANKSIFVLKCYNDQEVYGEEYIRLFLTREEARYRLRQLVQQEFLKAYDEVKAEKTSELDTVEDDYVSIENYGGGTFYCIIEEHVLDIPEKKAAVQLSDGNRIAAVVNNDADYKEIFVGIENEKGEWIQDLTVVGENYHYGDDNDVIPDNGSYSVKVFGNENEEDYTEEFDIPLVETADIPVTITISAMVKASDRNAVQRLKNQTEGILYQQYPELENVEIKFQEEK